MLFIGRSLVAGFRPAVLPVTDQILRTPSSCCVQFPWEHHTDVCQLETYLGGIFSGRLDQSATQSESFIRMSMSLSLSTISSSDCGHTQIHSLALTSIATIQKIKSPEIYRGKGEEKNHMLGSGSHL